MKRSLLALTILFLIFFGYRWNNLRIEEEKDQEFINLVGEVSHRILNDHVINSFEFNNKKIKTEFYFNEELESYIKKQMKLYASKAIAIVVLDNDTGKVISLLSYERESKKFGRSMALLASHPSASLSKIVTAADLIENAGYNPWTDIVTRGKGTTLYKYQLKKEHRWNRKISLEKAFAFSNNAAFGKAAIHNSTASSLYEMALSFGFNKRLSTVLKLPKSIFQMPKDQYNLAELASGFNTETMISPLHAAIFASIVANEGNLKRPKLIKSLLVNDENLLDEEISFEDEKVLSSDAADQLARLMTKTVEFGTARKSFRRMRRNLKSRLEIGGKTGSITGGFPEGKRDWFSAYARPKNGNNKGISVSVMSIQGPMWRAKSSYLAKNIIEYYYRQIEKTDVRDKQVYAKK
ncbi:MAG: hypothetical protein CME70_07025 [Halobacteriovorax sp.]|nr:hypothetical protein [Halobacteriovorax sp.]|tara:strand:+ start:437612 stop:438835 length:1224 start_codon:yes stop_codon:yes gene_type:complete